MGLYALRMGSIWVESQRPVLSKKVVILLKCEISVSYFWKKRIQSLTENRGIVQHITVVDLGNLFLSLSLN